MVQPNAKWLLVGEGRPAGSPAGFSRALDQLGIAHELLDESAFYRVSFANRAFNRFLRVPRFFGTGALNRAVLTACESRRPEVVLFFKPVWIRPQTVAEVRRMGAVACSWYGDDIFYPRNASPDFYRSIAQYDCHFCTKSYNVPELMERGARRAEFLPHGLDPTLHFPVTPTEQERAEWGSDIVFIGTFAHDKREHYLERLCREGYRIKVFGNGWQKLSADTCLRRSGAVQLRPAYGREFSLALNSGKIALAFLREHNRDLQTMRTYEIPGCGAFMLHERTPEVTAIFREGEEAEFFGSYEEMKRKIDRYLADDSARQRIALAGFRKATSGSMSFEARVRSIAQVCEELRAPSSRKAG